MPVFGPQGGALALGEPEKSIAFWRDRLLAKPKQLRANLWLARLLNELSREGEALPHWKAVLAADPENFEASSQLAFAARREGRSIEDAVAAATSGTARYAPIIRDLLRGDFDLADDYHARHVAIGGVSYCGSTVLDRILGSLPGCGSIGESHWLLKRRSENEGSEPLDPADPDTPLLVECGTCGRECPTLTFPFRVALAADRRRWYQRIARQLGVTTLISSDKNLTKLLENDPLLRFDAIVLFKSPAQAWRSQAAQFRSPPEDRASAMLKYFEDWRGRYSDFLDDFHPSGSVVYLNFDAFAQEPRSHLAALCSILGLPLDERVLDTYVPGHVLGGNRRVSSQLRGTTSMRIEPLAPVVLTADERAALDGDAATKKVFEALMRRYEQSFVRTAPSSLARSHAAGC